MHSKAKTMTSKFNVICALALSALAATGVQAQNTRADVKSDVGAGQPKGELSTPNQDKGRAPMASDTSRAAVKSEAQRARAAGEVAVGEQSTPRQGKKPAPRMASEKTRAQVKAEATAANKAGGLSRGEQSTPPQDKGGVKP